MCLARPRAAMPIVTRSSLLIRFEREGPFVIVAVYGEFAPEAEPAECDRRDLRESLVKLQGSDQEKAKKPSTVQRIDNNMSSAEKLKLELAKVRDDLKCQMAQLTTKIKHLSSVLLKMDKHSLKGLQAMVQQRKRLLKYLRRTDWDSYCLVLSKLGLRYKENHKN
ncbi:30S ribosomal protein S15 [Pyrus ussuriensis x Pyrus communis]|uniref:30S ribosomal protein S15 n=1 Tax=Pyrus ussuriensis x Pyrus communis TaxID=2448454 RepID=A0A5N5GPU1_9ROSA|nr:30S ribosomal protein S15 [Pyrus ussuriensis x Pyrus communis]